MAQPNKPSYFHTLSFWTRHCVCATLNPRPQKLYETKKSEAETYSYIAMSDREDNDSDAPEEFTFDQVREIN